MSTEDLILITVPCVIAELVVTGIVCSHNKYIKSCIDKVRPGTAVAIAILVALTWPLICIKTLVGALYQMILDIKLDLKNLKGFEKAKSTDYEKAINELIQMNPSVALISSNKDIRIRAESILNKKA